MFSILLKQNDNMQSGRDATSLKLKSMKTKNGRQPISTVCTETTDY